MSMSWIILGASALAFVTLGIGLGLLLADRASCSALISLFHFAARMSHKAFLRTFDSRVLRALEQVDTEYSSLANHEKIDLADPSALHAASLFTDRLAQIFGEELSAVYFFGSRLRGSHTAGSDVDVAIFFRPTVPLTRARARVGSEVLQVLLRHGLLIQPRLADDRALSCIDAESNPVIRRAVQTGILLASRYS
jgi:hypothetical protein